MDLTKRQFDALLSGKLATGDLRKDACESVMSDPVAEGVVVEPPRPDRVTR